MINFLIAVASTMFVLGVMILVHEWGHYIVAKLCGVRVEVFSVGFGKRLFGYKRGDTDYRISALPFGGYVKMSGENPMEASTGDPAEFMSHPRWQRFLIALAGPAMNVVLAVSLLTGLFLFHFPHEDSAETPAVIGYVSPNSPADKAGIHTGDRIARVDGVQDPKWENMDDAMEKAMVTNGAVNVFVQRGDQFFTAAVAPERRSGEDKDYFGWSPKQKNIISWIEPNMPAERSGLKLGDDIVSINGQPMSSMLEIQDTIQKNGTLPVHLLVSREGRSVSITATPQLVSTDKKKTPKLGFVAVSPLHYDKLPLPKAFANSVKMNKRLSLLIVDMLQKLVERKVSIKQMDGPIGIGKAAGEAARSGLPDLVLLMAMISMNLAIFNLLPIPILDGGLIMLLVVEGLMRRDIDQRIKERIYQTAFFFLVLFAVVVIFNDVSKML